MATTTQGVAQTKHEVFSHNNVDARYLASAGPEEANSTSADWSAVAIEPAKWRPDLIEGRGRWTERRMSWRQ